MRCRGNLRRSGRRGCQLQTLLDDSWSKLISLDSLVYADLSKLISEYEENNNIFIPSDIVDKLNDIKRGVKSSLDSDEDKFIIDYNQNRFGQIHELYIPINTEYVDNIVIAEIYDKSGDFVAHNLEEDINEPLYKIESSNLYTDNIDEENRSLYKKEKVDFKSKLNHRNSDFIENLNLYPVCAGVSLLPLMVYYITGSNGFLIRTMLVLSLLWMLYPICVFWTVYAPIEFSYYIYLYYVRGENTIYSSLFD